MRCCLLRPAAGPSALPPLRGPPHSQGGRQAHGGTKGVSYNGGPRNASPRPRRSSPDSCSFPDMGGQMTAGVYGHLCRGVALPHGVPRQNGCTAGPFRPCTCPGPSRQLPGSGTKGRGVPRGAAPRIYSLPSSAPASAGAFSRGAAVLSGASSSSSRSSMRLPVWPPSSTRSKPTTCAPSSRRTSMTPMVARPLLRTSSTPMRTTLLAEVSMMRPSLSRTGMAPTTGPVLDVTLKLMMPLPPRDCRR